MLPTFLEKKLFCKDFLFKKKDSVLEMNRVCPKQVIRLVISVTGGKKPKNKSVVSVRSHVFRLSVEK